MSKTLDLSELALGTALDANEFVLYYQPDFDPKTEEVSDLEAFLRWDHATVGLCDAVRFIAGIERSPELINRFDRWVLYTAMNQGDEFLAYSNVIKKISINVSSWLSGDELVASVSGALKATGFPAKSLSLECPWRMFAAYSAEIIPVMQQLDKMGCSLVMDGSPLEQECLDILKGVPVSTTKICYGALQQKVRDSGIDTAISLVKKLRRMKVTTIVVGVENDEHADLVSQVGCSLSQGNRFRSPLSSKNVLQLLDIINKTKDAYKLL